MTSAVNNVDIVVGLCWGDEAKGKVVSQLAKNSKYDLVARWAGGNNAGHTVYVDGVQYKTHLVPSGIFYDTPSLIGPGCVLHPLAFEKELDYLYSMGFNTDLVKVHPNCHIVQDKHIELDKQNLATKLGTTAKGIAYAYADKAARVGILAKDVLDKNLLWDQNLYGNILCEGAQGVWLDLDQGNYPYVTSSTTLPYGACSLGFAPQKIRNIYGCAKIYDTRSGQDPAFPDSLLEHAHFKQIGELGQEIGTTTGRRRKINWLDLSKLVESINMTGTTHVIISKCDVLESFGLFRLKTDLIHDFKTLDDMKCFINSKLKSNCPLLQELRYSASAENV